MKLSLLYYGSVCCIIAVCMFVTCFAYIGSVKFGGENQVVELSALDCFSSETIKIIGHQWY
ncbi:unnamed protein product [Hydatigera taeniaeformis]|uniref:Glycoprotein n=1 Tax=Hydatigena taeniaeformis TaxID=6205 RepID=A0A0R3XBJ9_HYDTA|nr:unnamed protein product [Hydatigera taeniaeformis]